LDFLGGGPSSLEKRRFWALEKLGFPWILSSESSNINWLQDIFAENIFRVASPLWRTTGNARRRLALKDRTVHMKSLT
jgi:hypothetical protein